MKVEENETMRQWWNGWICGMGSMAIIVGASHMLLGPLQKPEFALLPGIGAVAAGLWHGWRTRESTKAGPHG